MSSISGSTSLASFFQNLGATSNTSATAATTATSPTTTTSSTSASDASQAIHGGHHHHHHGHGDAGKSEFFQQLQTAVTNALQSAQQGGTDPNKTVQDAISQILKNSSNTTSTTTATANQPASTTDADGSPAQAGGPADGTPTSSLQAFFNTLQSYGIDPQQFHQDFLTAATNAQNGTANTSTAFQSIPPGTLLDAIG